jgi:hypothetical protein
MSKLQTPKNFKFKFLFGDRIPQFNVDFSSAIVLMGVTYVVDFFSTIPNECTSLCCAI